MIWRKCVRYKNHPVCWHTTLMSQQPSPAASQSEKMLANSSELSGWGRVTHSHSHGGTQVSLGLLISAAAGPYFRITLLSSQPRGAKLFKYSNSSLLPPTQPLSPASTLPLIICLFIVANLEAIPPINDANCSKWCRSWENGGEVSGRGERCAFVTDNALDFTSCCADINGWYTDSRTSPSPVLPHTLIVKQALLY